jgi:hypothetical protein
VRVVRKQRPLRRQARTGQNEAKPVAEPVVPNDGSNDGFRPPAGQSAIRAAQEPMDVELEEALVALRPPLVDRRWISGLPENN